VVALPAAVVITDFADLRLHRRGKVRDLYEVDSHLLIVATDRISAFDYVLGSGIPDKGRILTQMSAFWFESLRDVVPNHVLTTDPVHYPPVTAPYHDQLIGRSMLVRRTTPVPIECVGRGYLAGSAWKDYQRGGTVCGIALPAGLVESARLPAPLFTPATKAESGHDENVTAAEAARIIGGDLLQRLEQLTLALYARASAHAERCGIIIADTKFEFGQTADGELLLIDELLTPDSSRFWPLEAYSPGGPQPSFDKQFVRDYLESIAWNKQPPVPTLSDAVIGRTREKYLEAYVRLTGRTLL
jgi:phosphoribosylaminoimidazole-succinocarboxamide synthase